MGILDKVIQTQQVRQHEGAPDFVANLTQVSSTQEPPQESPTPVVPATGPRELLRINDLNLGIKGFDILKGVNASIIDRVTPGETRGQIVGILGPSGVGKTKLFECISGIRTAEDTGTDGGSKHTGEVLILDRDDVESHLVPVKPGRVGVVMQQYPLFEWRTVNGNLMVALEGTKLSKEEKQHRVNEILKKFQMQDRAKMYPCNLSGGQRQRVAIAQQLLSSGHFLLMDEPFSGLDVIMIKEVLSVIKQVADTHEYNTIIVVSHDIESTASIADTLWIMGRDRDRDNKIIPGARVKHVIDMVDRGLAYQPAIKSMPAFRELRLEIEEKIFPTL